MIVVIQSLNIDVEVYTPHFLIIRLLVVESFSHAIDETSTAGGKWDFGPYKLKIKKKKEYKCVITRETGCKSYIIILWPRTAGERTGVARLTVSATTLSLAPTNVSKTTSPPPGERNNDRIYITYHEKIIQRPSPHDVQAEIADGVQYLPHPGRLERILMEIVRCRVGDKAVSAETAAVQRWAAGSK